MPVCRLLKFCSSFGNSRQSGGGDAVVARKILKAATESRDVSIHHFIGRRDNRELLSKAVWLYWLDFVLGLHSRGFDS